MKFLIVLTFAIIFFTNCTKFSENNGDKEVCVSIIFSHNQPNNTIRYIGPLTNKYDNAQKHMWLASGPKRDTNECLASWSYYNYNQRRSISEFLVSHSSTVNVGVFGGCHYKYENRNRNNNNNNISNNITLEYNVNNNIFKSSGILWVTKGKKVVSNVKITSSLCDKPDVTCDCVAVGTVYQPNYN